jgi:hypothetical protein
MSYHAIRRVLFINCRRRHTGSLIAGSRKASEKKANPDGYDAGRLIVLIMNSYEYSY